MSALLAFPCFWDYMNSRGENLDLISKGGMSITSQDPNVIQSFWSLKEECTCSLLSEVYWYIEGCQGVIGTGCCWSIALNVFFHINPDLIFCLFSSMVFFLFLLYSILKYEMSYCIFNYREKAVHNSYVSRDHKSCTPLTWINVDFIIYKVCSAVGNMQFIHWETIELWDEVLGCLSSNIFFLGLLSPGSLG